MKKCFKCGVEKPLEDFYKHKKMEDGHLGKCKTCTKNDSELRRVKLTLTDPAWVEKEAERQRQKEKRRWHEGLSKPSKERKKKMMDTYAKKYPEKEDAKIFIMNKVSCPMGHHRHHWSYKKENHLDVIVLLIEDHFYIHRYLKYYQEEMCYKIKATGELLDTREKHENFINAILKFKMEAQLNHPTA